MEPSIIGLYVIVLANLALVLYLLIRPRGGKKTNHRGGNAIVIDTCALIDGRIQEIVRSGFAPDSIYIPTIVITELQFLADKGDAHKRERARFGLDVARELQTLKGVNVEVISPSVDKDLPVDDQLVQIAQKYRAMLYTTDYNLNKVADIKGVQVLNVNELAQGLRANYLPGESARIKLVERGQDKSQGVGYLDDGTMVVVERAGSKLQQSVDVTFTRMLQTHAGKMMFARLVGDKKSTDKPRVAADAPKHKNDAPQAAKSSRQPEKIEKPGRTSQRNRGKAATQAKHRKSPEDSLLEAVAKQ